MTENQKQRAYSWHFSLSCLGFSIVMVLLTSLSMTGLNLLLYIICFVLGGLFYLLTIIMFLYDIIRIFIPGPMGCPPRGKVFLAVPIWIVSSELLLFSALSPTLLSDIRSPRASIALAKAELRTLTMAIQSYRIDHIDYPAWGLNHEETAYGKRAAQAPILSQIPTFTLRNTTQLGTLTTPIAYLTDYDADPFAPIKNATFAYWNNATTQTRATRFIVWSSGPDRAYDLNIGNIAHAFDANTTAPTPWLLNRTYDPTNGTVSGGDVWRSE